MCGFVLRHFIAPFPHWRRGRYVTVTLLDSLTPLVHGGDLDWWLVAAHYERAERFGEAASAVRCLTDRSVPRARQETAAFLAREPTPSRVVRPAVAARALAR